MVSHTHRPRLPPGNIPGTHFCQRLSRPQGYCAAGRIMSLKNSSDVIGNRTRYLPACSAVPQPTAPPRTLSRYRTFSKSVNLSMTRGGRNSVFGVATHHWLEGSGIESRWERDWRSELYIRLPNGFWSRRSRLRLLILLLNMLVYLLEECLGDWMNKCDIWFGVLVMSFYLRSDIFLHSWLGHAVSHLV